MPVRAIVVTVKSVAYLASCDECKEWAVTFKQKANADTAMLAHRIVMHGRGGVVFGKGTKIQDH